MHHILSFKNFFIGALSSVLLLSLGTAAAFGEPSEVDTLMQKYHTARATGDIDGATATIHEAIARSSEAPEILLEAARFHTALNNLHVAESLYLHLLKNDITHPSYLAETGALQMIAKGLQTGEPLCRKALALSPNETTARFYIGALELHAQRPILAKHALNAPSLDALRLMAEETVIHRKFLVQSLGEDGYRQLCAWILWGGQYDYTFPDHKNAKLNSELASELGLEEFALKSKNGNTALYPVQAALEHDSITSAEFMDSVARLLENAQSAKAKGLRAEAVECLTQAQQKGVLAIVVDIELSLLKLKADADADRKVLALDDIELQHPREALIHDKMASVYMSDKNYRKAIRSFNRAAAEYPLSNESLFALACAYAGKEQRDEAQVALVKLEGRRIVDWSIPLSQLYATELLKDAPLNKHLVEIRKTMAQSGIMKKNPTARLPSRAAYADPTKDTTAVPRLEDYKPELVAGTNTTDQLEALDESGLNKQVRAALMQKDYSTADKALKGLLAIHPDSNALKGLRGGVLMRSQKYDQAEDLLIDAYANDPNSLTVRYHLVCTRMALGKEPGLKYYLGGIQLNEIDKVIRWLLADSSQLIVIVGVENYQQLLAHLFQDSTAVLHYSTDEVGSFANMEPGTSIERIANIDILLKRYNEAIQTEDWDSAIKRARKLYVAGLRNRALISSYAHGLIQDPELQEEGIRTMTKLVGMHSKDQRLKADYAVMLSDCGDNNKAVSYGREAYEGSPQNPTIASNYAMVLLGSKRADEALPVIQEAVELNDSPLNKFLLACALAAREDVSGASTILMELKESAPKDLAVWLQEDRPHTAKLRAAFKK